MASLAVCLRLCTAAAHRQSDPPGVAVPLLVGTAAALSCVYRKVIRSNKLRLRWTPRNLLQPTAPPIVCKTAGTGQATLHALLLSMHACRSSLTRLHARPERGNLSWRPSMHTADVQDLTTTLASLCVHTSCNILTVVCRLRHSWIESVTLHSICWQPAQLQWQWPEQPRRPQRCDGCLR